MTEAAERTELGDGVVTVRSDDGRHFAIEADGEQVGSAELATGGDRERDLRYALHEHRTGHGFATRAARLLVQHAFDDLGIDRVQARVPLGDDRAVRVATRAGLLREGVLRAEAQRAGDPSSYVLLARLRSDEPIDGARGFRSLLNSFLPRKRAIAQMLVRDRLGRVLTCRLTYKDDWDLPGGVVEVNESPREAVGREIVEELQLDLEPGGLLLTDWLPPWSGWDDALCLVFDGGVHDERILDQAVLSPREIRAVQFATIEEIHEHCKDFTARRIEAALAALDGHGLPYTESGRR